MCVWGGGLDVKSVQMGEKKSQETLLSPGTQLTTSTWTGRHHLQHEHSGRQLEDKTPDEASFNCPCFFSATTKVESFFSHGGCVTF